MNSDINKVLKGETSHLDFLKSSDEFENYKEWCRSHGVDVDEKSAEFYFDQTFVTDYNEEDVLMVM